MDSPIRTAIPVGVLTGMYSLSADATVTTMGAICPTNAPTTISGNRNNNPPMAVVFRKLMKRFDFLTIMQHGWVRLVW